MGIRSMPWDEWLEVCDLSAAQFIWFELRRSYDSSMSSFRCTMPFVNAASRSAETVLCAPSLKTRGWYKVVVRQVSNTGGAYCVQGG